MTPSGALRKIEASLGTEVDPRGVSYILHASAVQHVDPILHVTPTSLAPMLTPRHSHVNEDRDGLESVEWSRGLDIQVRWDRHLPTYISALEDCP
jgi:hypothetical protein